MSDKEAQQFFWSLSRTAVLLLPLQGSLWYTLLLPSDAKASTQRGRNKHFTTLLLQLQTIPNQFWNIYIFFFKREYHRHIVQFHSLIKTSRASYRLHISILFCLMISWTPRADFFPFSKVLLIEEKQEEKKKEGGMKIDGNLTWIILS